MAMVIVTVLVMVIVLATEKVIVTVTARVRVIVALGTNISLFCHPSGRSRSYNKQQEYFNPPPMP